MKNSTINFLINFSKIIIEFLFIQGQHFMRQKINSRNEVNSYDNYFRIISKVMNLKQFYLNHILLHILKKLKYIKETNWIKKKKKEIDI